MSLTITRYKKDDEAAAGPKFHLKEKLWFTADRKRLVKDLDPEAAFLFGVAGTEITMKQAVELGLVVVEAEKPAAEQPLPPFVTDTGGVTIIDDADDVDDDPEPIEGVIPDAPPKARQPKKKKVRTPSETK